MNDDATILMRLLEFTDSALPVGTFSFSNALETAAAQGLVHDADTLGRFTRDIVLQAAFTDGVVALHAFRSRLQEHYEDILEADRQGILCKLNAEARMMTRRMGKKFAELFRRIRPDRFVGQWIEDIDADRTPGCYPVAQGIVFAACGISEKGLFCAHQYGAANMVLSAALRCLKVSHYDTQRILYELCEGADDLYERTRAMDFEDMQTFSPQIDILASLHEKGSQRMFMN